MKPLIAILLATALFCGELAAQKKIALIIAVGEYPDGGRWRNLSSMNDLKYVKAALKKNGFTDNNIDTLVNQQATKENMLQSLNRLVANVSKGDIVFFQFSGHGQQIEDDNGDEADGYDEALIPYDAKAAYDPVTYNGQNHFRDDLLGAKLQLIRNKIGTSGSLLVLLDACYSGTATRGNEFAICRGDAHAFQSPGYEPKESLTKNTAHSGTGFLKLNNSESNMIVISASSPNQMNYESKDLNQMGVGSLSYAFAKAVSNLQDGSNYAGLFQKIKSQIQANIPTQVPMIEGELSQEVFSGKFAKKEENFIIDKWSSNDSTFYINGGILDNIVNGNNFKVYINDTGLVSEGFIKQTGLFQSLAISQKPIKKGEAYIVKFDGVSYGNFSGSIFINNGDPKNRKSAQLAKQLESQIKQYSYLSLTNNADMMLDIKMLKDGSGMISLVEKGDSIHYAKQVNAADSLSLSDWQYLLEGIKRTIRIKYFRNISDGGVFSNDVRMQVIPEKPSTDATGEIILNPNDQFSIKVSNKGTQPLYFTILDLLPNNDIKVLIPDEADEPQDYIIRPGETKSIDGIQVDAITPKGKEFFKAIFSKVPIDLRAILNRKRTRGSAELQSFEKVVDDIFSENNKIKNTRSEISKVKVEELGIITAGFTIQY
ncbi:MAG: caspase family protein [Bacteroidota bacterium]